MGLEWPDDYSEFHKFFSLISEENARVLLNEMANHLPSLKAALVVWVKIISKNFDKDEEVHI